MISRVDNNLFSKCSRAKFLTTAAASVLTIAAAPSMAAESQSEAAGPKGKPDSRLRRWAVITIGNLSRNRYWGESDAKGVHLHMHTVALLHVTDAVEASGESVDW